MGNEKFEEYVKDKRITCKYGYKCYQKSEQHHEKYKHPPKTEDNNAADVEADLEQVVKKRKICLNEDEAKDIKIYSSNSAKVEENESTPSGSSEEKNESKDPQQSKHNEMTSKDIVSPIKVEDAKKFIKDKFLVEMPEDFYYFWEFAQNIKPKNPLQCLSELGLVLVGPFDVLAGKFRDKDLQPDLYLIHWRYFHDPPEFQTILKESRDKTGFHIGYFRDSPQEMPVFLASNEANENGCFSILGDNIFTAVDGYLANLKETGNPFERAGFRKRLSKIRADLREFAKKKNIEIDQNTRRIEARQKKTVARSLNKLGILVPYNKKTQVGYRELPVDKKELKKILETLRRSSGDSKKEVLSKLQPILTAVNIAMDECDFGTGIELGWDLLSYDLNNLNATITQFLSAAYQSLDRNAFAEIITTHMDNRRKGCNLSILAS